MKKVVVEDIEMKIQEGEKTIDENIENKHQKVPNSNYVGNQVTQPEVQFERKRFQVPESLKKTFIATMVLAGLGVVLFICGFIEEVAMSDPGRGLTFWILGLVVMIPGGYYSYQFWKARRCQDEDQRNDIFNQIPEL